MEPRLRRRLLNTPLYCVGEKTADAARAQGFHDIHIADGDGKSLARRVLTDFPHTAQFLYLTGTPRKPHLEDELQAAGADLVAVDLYRSEPVSDWVNATKRAVQHVTQILHYSRASAEACLSLILKDEFLTKLRNARHLCLSEDVAIPLRSQGLKTIHIAAKPTEAALFDLIDRKDL
jgi:uroporphyrinogen-III synthase